MKSLSNISRTQLSNEKLIKLLDTYEEKGKEYYYDMLFEKDFDVIFRQTKEEDNFYIGKFFKFAFTDHKLRQLSRRDLKPQNQDEYQYRNYKRVISRIHQSNKKFDLFHSDVIDLSKMISKDVSKVQINYIDNPVKDLLNPNQKIQMTIELEKLINLFKSEVARKEHEVIALIINFYIDFVNMEVFNQYNEQIGLFLMFALIQKYFNVFKYVSFFKYLYQKQNVFNQGILEANYNWHEGYSSYERLYTLFIDILQDSYDELKKEAHRYEFIKDLAKGDNVEASILKIKTSDIFSKQDVRDLNPLVSDSTIERTLKKMRDEGTIRPLGTGRSAKWQLIRKQDEFQTMQLSLFSEADFE